MELKTLTWNIGGGKLLPDGADPLRIASYAENGLDAIAGLLESEQPDVIALQETQRKEGRDQARLIAGSLGYEHYFHDSTSRLLDHILYRGLALKSKRIVSGVRTDHYPVIATFEVR